MVDLVARFPDVPEDRDFGRFLERSIPGFDAESGNLPVADDGVVYGLLRQGTVRGGWAAEDWGVLESVVRSNAPVIEAILAQDLSGFGCPAGVRTEADCIKMPPRDRVFDRITLFKSLAVQAAYEAELGRADRAVTALERGYQVARVRSSVGLISAIGGEAGEAITLPAVEQVLNRVPLGEAELARLARILPRTTNLLERAMVIERALGIMMADQAVSVLVPQLREKNLRGTYFRLLAATRGYGGRMGLLERFTRIVDASRLPAVERLREASRLDAEWAAIQASYLRMLQTVFDLDFRILWALQPRFSQLFRDDLANQNGLAVAQAAVAVERWRRTHGGAPPGSLADLGSADSAGVPPDPVSGGPLRYRRVGSGYRIYAGSPQASEDPQTETTRGGASGYDMVFRVER